jgi:tetratricopeptide (TPR) repeat protein
MSSGRADQAIALLEPTCNGGTAGAREWQLLGFALREEQRMPEAITAFERAEQLDRDAAHTATALAQTRIQCGQPAIEACWRALALSPQDDTLVLGLASAHVAAGERTEAEALLAAAVARRPDWLQGQWSLAEIRWTGGDRQGFARGYAEACVQLPSSMPLRMGWFQLVALTRDWPAARSIIEEGERIQGAKRSFVVARAFIAAESGARAEAESLFEQTRGWNDEVRDLAWIRHCLRQRRAAEAEPEALRLAGTRSARQAWPYLSLIWRLAGDARAQWLDGDPPYVRALDVDLERGQLDELAELLRKLHTARSPYLEQSVRGGTQTERPLFFRTEPIVQLVRARVLDSVREYIAGLQPREDGHPLLGPPRSHLLFSGSWSVRLLGQGHNVAHTHPLGWISSAFYVSLPTPTQMGAPPAGRIRFGRAPAELGLDLPHYAEVEPRVGRLALFPSTMWHETVPFADGERLVLAFDVRPPDR